MPWFKIRFAAIQSVKLSLLVIICLGGAVLATFGAGVLLGLPVGLAFGDDAGTKAAQLGMVAATVGLTLFGAWLCHEFVVLGAEQHPANWHRESFRRMVYAKIALACVCLFGGNVLVHNWVLKEEQARNRIIGEMDAARTARR